MLEKKDCIWIKSEMNNWINICILVHKKEDVEKIHQASEKAYDEWFNIDTDEPITDYIQRKLNEENFEFEILTGPFNDDEEDLL